MGLHADTQTRIRRSQNALIRHILSAADRRRSLLTGISTLLVTSNCALSEPARTDINFHSAAEAVAFYLEAAGEKNSLNAYVYLDGDRARRRAERIDADRTRDFPLKGWVLAVKDNIHVEGMPNAAGTESLRNFWPDRSSPVVERLQAAGAVMLGKTNMHELAYGVTNNNFAFGPSHNPVDTTRIPGGSSGGSAVVVAAGLARAALGTDTGGSVRIPAALTGVVGYRPTTGRYQNDDVALISPTRDTIGLITKSVSDAMTLDDALMVRTRSTETVSVDGVRLGLPTSLFFENLDPDVDAAIRDALATLQTRGAVIVPVDVEAIASLNQKVGFPIVLHETGIEIPQYLKKYNTGVSVDELRSKIASPDVRILVDMAFSGVVSQSDYDNAVGPLRQKLIDEYRRCFESNSIDALVFPTTPITARKIDDILGGVTVNGALRDTFATYIQNTDPGSNAGLPGISIPVGVDREGLPIGLELDARPGDDDRLLSIASAIERILAGVEDAGSGDPSHRANSISKSDVSGN